jgi:pyruvate dehydrogenase E2 component (dihydrolipoamide acetyltransferase)
MANSDGKEAAAQPVQETHLGVKVRKSGRQTPIMRLTAQHMLASHSGSAPFTVFGECAADRLIAAHGRFAARTGAPKVTYSHLLVRIIAQALRRHPELNAALVEETMYLYDEVNIGVATALADGNLLVPVVRQADTLSVDEIARRADELIARARGGKIRPEDMRGGTFTLSNVGMFPAVWGATPLVNLPQAGILATGAIQHRAVVRDGKVDMQAFLGLSLTVDHRAVNGFLACRFVQTLADLIADPDDVLGAAE